MRMVITDFDGTLLQSDGTINEKDLNTLIRLGENKILRVIATGRSVFSIKRVLPDVFPIDYLIFSCGAGTMNWSTKEIFNTHSLSKNDCQFIFNFLINEQLDFTIQRAIPNNHYFYYYRTEDSQRQTDFDLRLGLYKNYCIPVNKETFTPEEVCQFIVIGTEVTKYEFIKEKLSDYKIIRSTSPLDHTSIWIEIFHKDVSKANASEYLAKQFNIQKKDILVVGNDYNDIDLLEWSENSFVVANAPLSLKQKYQVVSAFDKNGFTEAVNCWHKFSPTISG